MLSVLSQIHKRIKFSDANDDTITLPPVEVLSKFIAIRLVGEVTTTRHYDQRLAYQYVSPSSEMMRCSTFPLIGKIWEKAFNSKEVVLERMKFLVAHIENGKNKEGEGKCKCFKKAYTRYLLSSMYNYGAGLMAFDIRIHGFSANISIKYDRHKSKSFFIKLTENSVPKPGFDAISKAASEAVCISLGILPEEEHIFTGQVSRGSGLAPAWKILEGLGEYSIEKEQEIGRRTTGLTLMDVIRSFTPISRLVTVSMEMMGATETYPGRNCGVTAWDRRGGPGTIAMCVTFPDPVKTFYEEMAKDLPYLTKMMRDAGLDFLGEISQEKRETFEGRE